MFENVVKACKYIYYNEPIAKEARSYLDDRLSKNAQDDYDFGYFPPNEHLDLLFEHIGKEELKKDSLVRDYVVAFAKTTKGQFANHNLIFPFKDSCGEIVSLVGRTLLSENERKELKIQKYNYTYGTRKTLYAYGLDIAKRQILKKDFVILVEGQFDCIALHEKGIMNAVALGWADMSIFQLSQVARYTKNIILLLDNDDAGEKGTEKIMKVYGNNFNFKKLKVPSIYKDVDEFLKKEKTNDFIKELMSF